MGLVPTKTFVFSVLVASLCISLAFGYDENIVTEAVPPIPPHHHHGPILAPSLAPTHHHHHHHHHIGHPPSLSPTAQPPSHHHHKGYPHPPVHPPTHAPAQAPSKLPVHSPVMPPVHSPIKPPVHPPVKPPVHPPVKPPVHPPVKPPGKPPVHPPVKPPVHPPVSLPKRKFIAVQGVVYCKSCKYKGVNTLLGATPLLGATVKLQCNNTRYRPVITNATTDKNGYFMLKAPKTITTYGAHKCKVSLVSSPLKTCSQPTDLHGGVSGSTLYMDKKSVPDAPVTLYNVGPFAFEPAKWVTCTH